MNQMTFKLLAICSLSLSNVATAATYSHRLRSFGSVDSLPICERNLQDVVQRFAAAAGVEILGAACEANDIYRDGSLDGEITYAAAARVPIYTTDVRSIVGGVDGHYTSLEDCRQALAQEKTLLMRLTGLDPFVSYCYVASSIGAPRYRAHMDAVGESAIKKWSTNASFDFPFADRAAGLAAVTRLGTDRGWSVVATSSDHDVSSMAVSMDYYAEVPLRLHGENTVRWRNAEVCETRGEGLVVNWPADAPPIVTTCDRSANGTYGLVLFWLSPSIFPSSDIRFEALPTNYASDAVCDSDRARVEAALARSGTEVYGTVCGVKRDQTQTRMLVLSKGSGPEDDDVEP